MLGCDGVPRIHMETLRAQPDITLKKILQWLDLNPDDSRALIKIFMISRIAQVILRCRRLVNQQMHGKYFLQKY